MDLYFDRRGRALDHDQWLRAAIARGRATEQVARTDTGRGHVSTIFTGMDLGVGWGPPLLYETMVFGGPLDGAVHRYASERQAVAGHRHCVRILRALRRRPALIHNGGRPRR